MASKTEAADLRLVPQDKAPVQIHGEAGRLYGTLTLLNQGTDLLTLRSIPIRAAKLKDKDAGELNALRVRGRLSPQAQGKVRINYEIDPSTPPGIYKAKLMIGDEEHDADISIAENTEIDIEPDIITLNTAQQPQLTRDLSVTNIGNVNIQLGNKLIVPVKSDCMFESALQRGIATLTTKRSAKELQLQDVLKAVADQLAGPITLSWSATTIKPGERKVLTTKIKLPENLQPHAYYYAEIELYSSSVRVDIYT
jgi:hypothetical protein